MYYNVASANGALDALNTYDHICAMPRPSHREKLLTEGMRVVHERGFAAASVRDIVKAAGVPQGSFTNHFASKEVFGLAVMDLYLARAEQVLSETLRNEKLTPLARLKAYIDTNLCMTDTGARNGCLFGNFSADTAGSDAIRERLVAIFADVQRALSSCLQAAVKAGEIPADIDCDDIAGFILSAMQGAILLGKANRSAAPMQRFRRILFSNVLRVPARSAAP